MIRPDARAPTGPCRSGFLEPRTPVAGVSCQMRAGPRVRALTPVPPPAPVGRELDDVTLRRAQRGDHGAFRALVELYQGRVWDLTWRMLAPSGLGHRAEDVCQETLVRVYRALAGFEPGGSAKLSTWILTIATRRALTELSRRRPRQLSEDELLAELEASDIDRLDAGGSGANVINRRQLGERLARAIGTLPDGARAVLLLRDLYDLDYAEIAHVLDLDLGTVKSRLARARAAVRARLGEQAP